MCISRSGKYGQAVVPVFAKKNQSPGRGTPWISQLIYIIYAAFWGLKARIPVVSVAVTILLQLCATTNHRFIWSSVTRLLMK